MRSSQFTPVVVSSLFSPCFDQTVPKFSLMNVMMDLRSPLLVHCPLLLVYPRLFLFHEPLPSHCPSCSQNLRLSAVQAPGHATPLHRVNHHIISRLTIRAKFLRYLPGVLTPYYILLDAPCCVCLQFLRCVSWQMQTVRAVIDMLPHNLLHPQHGSTFSATQQRDLTHVSLSVVAASHSRFRSCHNSSNSRNKILMRSLFHPPSPFCYLFSSQLVTQSRNIHFNNRYFFTYRAYPFFAPSALCIMLARSFSRWNKCLPANISCLHT